MDSKPCEIINRLTQIAFDLSFSKWQEAHFSSGIDEILHLP